MKSPQSITRRELSGLSRREWLSRAGCGFGGLALSALTTSESLAAGASSSLHGTHFPARAKQVIFLYMHGGCSHIDSWDHKPALVQRDGQKLPPSVNTARNKFNGGLAQIMQPPWRFRQHGESGLWGSELFRETNTRMDDLCFLYSMYSNNNAHTPATLELHTGSQTLMRPSVGSWINYGLGSLAENLPGFVTICPPLTYGGQRNFGSAFLPAAYQGTMIGTNRLPVAQARVRNIQAVKSATEQRRLIDFIAASNRDQQQEGSDSTLEARIASFELAYRMQQAVPEVMDLGQETAATRSLYGIDNKTTENYGRELLLARRLVERGVRFVHVAHTGGRGGRWDQHSALKVKHEENARSCDRPISGLIADLKQRGLLQDTLVVWSTEFGRTPERQNGTGRGHHAQGFTFWLAGGGVKSGFGYGATDEFGYHAVEKPVSIHDLHATILHLLGLDHTRLTYRYSGRDFRLTDVHGRVLHDVLS
jgi:hypothetical protein